ERQNHALGRRGSEQMPQSGKQRDQCGRGAKAVDQRIRHRRAPDQHGGNCGREKRGGTRQCEEERHGGGLLSRTPRPPLALVALSEMSSMPPISSAATSFIKESTLPRITPSLASMRWMVGSDRPDNFASLRWSMPSSARADRSCAAVIMFQTSIVTYMISILGFTTGKIRFQVFQDNPVIPTICPYRSELGQCRRNGGTQGDNRARSGKSQSASWRRRLTLPTIQPSWLSHAGTTGERLRRWIAFSVRTQSYFHALTTGINLRRARHLSN